MKIALVVAALGRGGAERQLMRLSKGLVERGHAVEVWCYGGVSDSDDDLRGEGVTVRNSTGSRLSKIYQLRRWMRSSQPDVVHGFMKRASSLAVISRGFRRRPVLVGSDLSTATYGRRDLVLWASLVLFAFAQCTTTQTQLNKQSIQRLAPWLRRKVRVIRNGLDLSGLEPYADDLPPKPFRFVSVGSVYPIKNPLLLVEAVALLVQHGRRDFVVDWYGRLGLGGDDDPSEMYARCVERIEEAQLEDHIRFHGESSNIGDAYRSAHALIHPSVQEGFPNAVVEGMAYGLPVLVSRVSDLPAVVDEARNGRVFDETKPQDIAEAMAWMMDLASTTRRAMGERSSVLSRRWFSIDRFIDEYEALYMELLGDHAVFRAPPEM